MAEATRKPKKYQIWDKKSSVITPSGKKFTWQEWRDMHVPWYDDETIHTVISAGIVNGGEIHELGRLVEFTNDMAKSMELEDFTPIDMNDFSDPTDVLLAIEDVEDRIKEESRLATSPEERIAAALEEEAMNKQLAELDDTPTPVERIAAIMEEQQMDAEIAKMENAE